MDDKIAVGSSLLTSVMRDEYSPTLYILTGPTATGKTELGLNWAEINNAEIVSCDAVQIYRGMDIGSAKPSEAEQARVPHHGIDLVEPHVSFSVGEYARYVSQKIADIAAKGKRVLVLGGSGFYLKSFLAPVVDTVAVPDDIREEVRQRENEAGLPGLLADLRAVNPAGLGGLDTLNARRVARALERCRASGKTVLALQAEFAALPKPFPEFEKQVVVIDRSDAELQNRIRARTRKMLENGLLEEVKRLLARGLEKNPSAARSVGYREVIDWLRSPQASPVGPSADDLERLATDIDTATWRLVRKQRSWFRNQLPGARRAAADAIDSEHLFPQPAH